MARAQWLAVEVWRAPRGRLSVSVRAGATVAVTGKCLGLSEGVGGAPPRVGLTDAVVLRPPNAGAK